MRQLVSQKCPSRSAYILIRFLHLFCNFPVLIACLASFLLHLPLKGSWLLTWNWPAGPLCTPHRCKAYCKIHLTPSRAELEAHHVRAESRNAHRLLLLCPSLVGQQATYLFFLAWVYAAHNLKIIMSWDVRAQCACLKSLSMLLILGALLPLLVPLLILPQLLSKKHE